MPHFRLRIRNAMVAVAVVAVHLAIYAAIYRRSEAIYRPAILIGTAGYLGLLYTAGAFAYAYLRRIRSRRDPTWIGLSPGEFQRLNLTAAGLIMGGGLLGILFILMRL
jgi:uncharacterized oligopeptide transporter (OPT) family protein